MMRSGLVLLLACFLVAAHAENCVQPLSYWVAASSEGSLPRDAAWGQYLSGQGEAGVFRNSGLTALAILTTSPNGNLYLSLARQYIVAELNILRGAAAIAGIPEALATFGDFFNGQGITPDADLTPYEGILNEGILLLDGYNGGMFSVPACGACGDLACQNGGTCTQDGDGEYCSCPPGFYGPNCGETECTTCQGELTSLTLQYLGAAKVYVQIQEGRTNRFALEGQFISQGESVTINGLPGKSLTDNIDIFVNFKLTTTIHTCCDHKPAIGLIFDDWKITAGASPSGTICKASSDVCAFWLCENGGTCFEGQAYPQCTCAPGFTGQHCEVNIDECTSNPCGHGSTCIDGNNGFTCTCTPGFTGSDCQTNIDDCVGSPCQNGGTCVDVVNGYSCICDRGFTGDDCSRTEEDECASTPCKNGATCYTINGDYACRCADGFKGKDCADVDNCKACTGGISRLVLRYVGATNTTVRAKEEQTGKDVFDRAVCPAEVITIAAVDESFGAQLEIFVDGTSNAIIKTDCTVEFGPGSRVGSFEVVEGYSGLGGADPLCPVKVPVSFKYTIDDATTTLAFNGVDVTLSESQWNEVDTLTWNLAPGSGPHVLALSGKDVYGVLQGIVARLYTDYQNIYRTGGEHRATGLSVRYTTATPIEGWKGLGFDDSSWREEAVFDGACVNHLDAVEQAVGAGSVWVWPGGCSNQLTQMWTRITFTVPELPTYSIDRAYLRYTIDDGTNEIYVDGRSVALDLPNRYHYNKIDTVGVNLTPGKHVIAGTGKDIYGHCTGFVGRVYDKCGNDIYVTGGPTTAENFKIVFSDTDPGTSDWQSVNYDSSAWTTTVTTDSACNIHSDEIENLVGGGATWVWPGGCGSLDKTLWFRIEFDIPQPTASIKFTIDDTTSRFYINGVRTALTNDDLWNVTDLATTNTGNGDTVFALRGRDLFQNKTGIVAHVFDHLGATLYATGSTPASKVTVKFTNTAPDRSWPNVGFDDSAWDSAPGTSADCDAHDNTVAAEVGGSAKWVWPGGCLNLNAESYIRITIAGPCADGTCDQCAKAPCQNGGTCVSGHDSFTCQCPEAFTGFRCETPQTPCDLNPCQNGGTCVSTPQDDVPQCPSSEFTNDTLAAGGVFRLKNHRDGSARPPLYGLRLDRLLGGRKIVTFDFEHQNSTMKMTWDAVAKTILIDGKAVGGKDCGNNYCNGYPKTYHITFLYKNVQIKSNYLFIPVAVGDQGWIVEEESEKAWKLVSSQMRNSFFKVKQNHRGAGATWSGWGWVDHSNKPHVAASDWLFEIGDCISSGAPQQDFPNQRVCQCPAGFTGENCETNIDDCAENLCQNGATCVDGVNSYTCKCNEDFTGTYCQTSLHTCGCAPCYNGGTCLNNDHQFSCVCPEGYYGTDCSADCGVCNGNIQSLKIRYEGNTDARVQAYDCAAQDEVQCNDCNSVAKNGQCEYKSQDICVKTGDVDLYNVTYEGHSYSENKDVTTFTYTVCQFNGAKDVSHWGLGICDQSRVVSSTPYRVESVENDRKTGLIGVKWDKTQKQTCKEYSISMRGLYTQANIGQIHYTIKAGQGCWNEKITGPLSPETTDTTSSSKLVFDQELSPGDNFTVTGAGTFNTFYGGLQLRVNGKDVAKIDTSCETLVGPGYSVSIFTVISGESRLGGPLCPVEAPQQVRDEPTTPNDRIPKLEGLVRTEFDLPGSGPAPSSKSVCSTCSGMLGSLFLIYTGTQSNQHVRIYDAAQNKVFDSTVTHANGFSVPAFTVGGSFGTHVSVYTVAGSTETLHATIPTDCSHIAYSGAQYGSFVVKSSTLQNDSPLCLTEGGQQGTDLGKSDSYFGMNVACGVCSGSVKYLTLRYDANEYTQDCGSSPARVTAHDADGVIVFNKTMSSGGTFTLSHTTGKDLTSSVSLRVCGQTPTKVSTSCASPTGPGSKFGDFTVMKGESSQGGNLCSLQNAAYQGNDDKPFQETNAGMAVIGFGALFLLAVLATKCRGTNKKKLEKKLQGEEFELSESDTTPIEMQKTSSMVDIGSMSPPPELSVVQSAYSDTEGTKAAPVETA